MVVKKGIGDQRGTKVTPWYKHCSSCGWWKGTSQDEATLISEEIKPLAPAVLESCLSEGIISKSVSTLNMKFLKFHNYSMEGFRIDLKTFLGLAKPNQYSQVSESKYQAGFGMIIWAKIPKTSWSLYIVLPYYNYDTGSVETPYIMTHFPSL